MKKNTEFLIKPEEKKHVFNSNFGFAFLRSLLALFPLQRIFLFRHNVASRGKGLCRMGSTVGEIRQTMRTHPTTSMRRNPARTQPTATREGRIVG